MTKVGAALDRAAIAARVPHAGRMCLLSRVTAWSEDALHAEADRHDAIDHPLAAHGRLGASTAIEYAAQAMAVHGSLLGDAGRGASPRAGYLASARGVTLHAARLDDVPGPLRIEIRAQSGASESPMLYRFELRSGDGRLLVEGRAAVVPDDALAARLLASTPPVATGRAASPSDRVL